MYAATALQTDGVNATDRSSSRPEASTSWMASRHGLPAVIEMNTSGLAAAIVVTSLVSVGAAGS